MKLKQPTIVLTTGMIISTSMQAYADDEVTIRMMEIDETTQEAVTKVIPLPEKSKQLKLQQQKTSNGKSETDAEKTTEQEQLRLREMEKEQEMIQEAQEQRIEAEIQHNEQMQERVIEQESGSDTIKNMNPNQ